MIIFLFCLPLSKLIITFCSVTYRRVCFKLLLEWRNLRWKPWQLRMQVSVLWVHWDHSCSCSERFHFSENCSIHTREEYSLICFYSFVWSTERFHYAFCFCLGAQLTWMAPDVSSATLLLHHHHCLQVRLSKGDHDMVWSSSCQISSLVVRLAEWVMMGK